MDIVQTAQLPPHHCAVIPFMANSNASGWIDTKHDLPCPCGNAEHVYVSFEGAAELSKMIGWVPKSHVRAREQENASLKAELEQVKAELQEAEQQLTAIDYLSKHGQMKAYAKAGRPKKEVTT